MSTFLPILPVLLVVSAPCPEKDANLLLSLTLLNADLCSIFFADKLSDKFLTKR